MAAPDAIVYIVRVFNPDGSPYLDPIGRTLASHGVSPAATGYSAYSEAERDRRIATAEANGFAATWEIASDWRAV
ncbi:hypothetical protein [Kitasatospora sp. NPDC127116]|uniref:hypothetical protein n=1 Tax=Kitasatospora sp. NPDC127116 TaxID=3345367 RepID=UPI00362AF3A3